MAYTVPSWVRAWLFFSTIIVLWDAAYCFLRPRSMPGGDLAALWAPYNAVPYSMVDLLYGLPALDSGDGFTNAQSLLNVVEAVLNVICLYLGTHPAAPVVGFAAVVMTASKTILYFLQEYYCSWCMVGHNDSWTFWTVWVVPNGIWIVMPSIVAAVLGSGLTNALQAASAVTQIPAYEAVTPTPIVSKSNETETEPNPYPTPYTGASLPLTFHPRGLPVLVVGSNRLVSTRVFALLEAGADVFVASSKPLSELPEEVQWRVNHGQVRFERFDTATVDVGVWTEFIRANRVVLVCVTDTVIGVAQPTISASDIQTACSQLAIPINVSDRPALSTFSFPSVHRFPGAAGPSNLQVAVSTNGVGCRIASRIRRDIAAKLPSNVGAAVDTVGQLRSKAKGLISDDDLVTPLNTPPKDDGHDQLRRMRWVHQMSEYYSYDQLAKMTPADMSNALDSAADAPVITLPHHEGKTGRILLIGSGPGHPSLLTVAAQHALQNATLILSDKLVPSEIISLIPSTTKLHIARKFPGNADGAQNELMDLALKGARAGEIVVRLKQGDPFVYGRGGEEVLFFREHGFEPVVVPGVSSALAGPLMMGIPVTQRGVADSFIMCTGVGRQGAAVQLPGYIKSRTLTILMGVARIHQVIEALTGDSDGRDGAAYPGHLPIAVVERASSPDQRVILSTLDSIEAALSSVEQRPPGMMLVGWAAMCLEGTGRVDILDGANEEQAVASWLAGDKFKIREGLPEEWKWFGSF